MSPWITSLIKAFADVQVCMTIEAINAQVLREEIEATHELIAELRGLVAEEERQAAVAVALEELEPRFSAARLALQNAIKDTETIVDNAMAKIKAQNQQLRASKQLVEAARLREDDRTRRQKLEAQAIIEAPPTLPPDTALSTLTPVTEDEVRTLLKDAEVQQAVGQELLAFCRDRGLLTPSDVEVSLYNPITGTREALPAVPPGPTIPMFAPGVDRGIIERLRDHRPRSIDEFSPARVGVDPDQPLPCETKQDMLMLMAHAVDRVRRSERVQLGGALARLQLGLMTIRKKELSSADNRRLEG